MLQWEKISADEWESIASPKKQTKWDSLLAEIEKGSIIKLPLGDSSEKRGFRIGIARAAKGRGYKVEFRESDGYLAMRQGEEVEEKPKRRAKISSSTDVSGEPKRRGRPRKNPISEEVDAVVIEEVIEPMDQGKKTSRSRRSQSHEEELDG